MSLTMYEHIYRVELQNQLKRHDVGLLAAYDSKANRFGAKLERDGTDIDATGYSVHGYFIRPNAETVLIEGAASGNMVHVDLPANCYYYDGAFTLSVKISKDGFEQTVLICDGRVGLTRTDVLVDEERILPTLAEIAAKMEAADEATASANEAASSANAAAGTANNAANEASNAAQTANAAAQNAETAANEIKEAKENGEFDGADGVGIAKVEQTTKTMGSLGENVVTVTLEDGRSYNFSVWNGARGEKGEAGDPGADGTSVNIVSVTSSGTSRRVEFSDGTVMVVPAGPTGNDGEDGISPVVSVSDITGGHRITITDANGTKTFDVMDGADGTSVSVESVTESSEDGGDNTLTFTDGKTMIVKNGNKGSDGVGIETVITSKSPNENGEIEIAFKLTDGQTHQFAVKYGKDGSDAEVTSENITSALGYTPANAETVSQLSEAMADKVTSPSVAEVGQVIAVKAVDENGKPTEWEAIDPPQGGGGASSWNDLTDKPFEEKKSYTDTLTVQMTAEEINNAVESGQLIAEQFLKTSDSVVTSSDLANGYTVTVGEEIVEIPAEEVGETIVPLADGVLAFFESLFISVDEQAVGVEIDGMVFHEKGLYTNVGILFEIGTISLSIPDYSFLVTEITPIDEKFIPAGYKNVAQIQSDWNQTDETAVDYIKNKPNTGFVFLYGISKNGVNYVSEDASEAMTMSRWDELTPIDKIRRGEVFIDHNRVIGATMYNSKYIVMATEDFGVAYGGSPYVTNSFYYTAEYVPPTT